MKILPIASSSSGNSTYIYTDRTRILIDVGTSVKHIVGKTGLTDFDAIFITHDHSDHVKSVGAAGRKFKCPVYMHPDVKTAVADKLNNVTTVDLNPSDIVTIKDLEVTSFSTKHDAKYTYGFLIKDLINNKKLCYLTDTGMITPLMVKYMKGADAYFIETDYDVKMLNDYEDYTEFLKNRIASAFGHLSNDDAMDGLEKIGIDKTEFIIFAHLSPRTNDPDKVMTLAKNKFPNYNGNFKIAPFDDPLEL